MEIDADLTEPPLISTAPSPCTPSMPCWGGGGDGCGYSAEVIPWLMWHVCLRPWRLLTARIIIVIMWQLKRERSIRTGGGGGLMVREMDVHRLQGSGKCIKVAIHSDPPTVLLQSCGLLPPVLIDIHSQSILLCCRKNRRKSTCGGRKIRHAGGKIKRRFLMRRHKSAGSVGRLYEDAAAEW